MASILTVAEDVDRTNLRVTAAVTVGLGMATILLPWARHPRAVAVLMVATTIALLGVSDHFHRYSSEPAALAVYPVFYIMLVTWCGFTVGRGVPSIVAVACVPVLIVTFASTGSTSEGLQCAVVTLPASAMLGEVLAYSLGRTHALVSLEADRRLRDPLTGLANRFQLNVLLDQALARSRRQPEVVSVLFVDLDAFKQVNDSLGHTAGDDLLVQAARRMIEVVRVNDTVARFGGDEFLVLLEGTTVAETDAVARRLIDSLSQPFLCGPNQARIGASIGAVVTSGLSETCETLLKKADIAMYRAKSNGRGRVELFDSAMQEWVAARHALEASLRSAVDNGELRLEYQPIVDALTGATVCFEALLRWDRPGVGPVPPAEFIEFAEELGLIVDIGEWVLVEACRQSAEWSRNGRQPSPAVAVNIASNQLRNGVVLDQVERALERSGLDPSRLMVEITESSLIDDGVDASSTLATLRRRGVRIALDDFGTGYCSLSYVRSLPIDMIKIDRSLVRSVNVERRDAALIGALVSLAASLDIEVVAEGVETVDQLASLLRLGCGLVQGYLFATPLPPEDAVRFAGSALVGTQPSHS